MTRPQITVPIEVLEGQRMRAESWASRAALERRGLIELMPPACDGTRRYTLTESGCRALKGYLVAVERGPLDPYAPPDPGAVRLGADPVRTHPRPGQPGRGFSGG